jgi:hypothetical protein
MPLDVRRIPPSIGYYLAGFTDGEGSFHVVFRPRSNYRMPWKISLCFNISQRDPAILALFKRYLRCGTMRQREDGVWYYEVNDFHGIVENVIPFFERFQFLSVKKRRDFSKFKRIARIIQEGRHMTLEGIREILRIRRNMNDGGKRRYTEEEILARFQGIPRDHTPGTLQAQPLSVGEAPPVLEGDDMARTP